MKAKLFVLGVILICASVVRGGDAKAQPAFRMNELPRFDGYVGTAADMLFVLAILESDGSTGTRLWLRVGQKIGRFEIAAFDSKKEELTLKSPDAGEITIRLVDSKVLAGGNAPPLSRDTARAYALDLIGSFLSATRQEHPSRSVIVNPDLAQMPDEKRSRFIEKQSKLQKNGQFLTLYLLPDGRWGEAISGDEAKKLPASVKEKLSEEDRREINRAWALARTEALARGIPPREVPAK